MAMHNDGYGVVSLAAVVIIFSFIKLKTAFFCRRDWTPILRIFKCTFEDGKKELIGSKNIIQYTPKAYLIHIKIFCRLVLFIKIDTLNFF